MTGLTISGRLRIAPEDKELLAVPVFKLADEHPLTKAGLRCIHVVEKAGLGLRSGDIVFEFPLGHIVDTGMACRRDGIIPPEIDIMTIHKEANATRADCNQKAQEEKGTCEAGTHPIRDRSPSRETGASLSGR